VVVVDANVVATWLTPGASIHSPAARLLRRFRDDDEHVIAPRLLHQEVANSLITGARLGQWSGEAADAAFTRLSSFRVELIDEPQDLDRAWWLARRYDNHPVYDMVYVALAERFEVDFVTLDKRLLKRLAGLPWVKTIEE